MSAVREIFQGETRVAYSAMLELRPDLGSADDFARVVDEVMRPEGYRLAGSFTDGSGDAVAVAGFRIEYLLARGRNLYVDDLVTRAEHRGAGHADRLMKWMVEQARAAGCREFHLDSAPFRHDAHRFYLNHGMHISSFHFRLEL